MNEEIEAFSSGDPGYYFNLFVKSKRVLILIGIPLFSLFMSMASYYGPADEEIDKEIFVVSTPCLLEIIIAVLVYLVATGAHYIEKLSKKTFWYMYLSLFTGTMIFLIPALVIMQIEGNIVQEIPFIILVTLSIIPPQIPIVLRYRRYLDFHIHKEWYIPNPGVIAFDYAIAPGALISVLVFALRSFGLDGVGYGRGIIPLGYFSTLLICILIFFLTLFLSYRKTLKVIEKDEEPIPMIRIR